MKTFMRAISALLVFVIIIYIIGVCGGTDIGDDFYSFFLNVEALFLVNLIPILSIAICAFCLERNDNNVLVRIIPVYMMVPILITIICVLFEINDGFLVDAYKYLTYTFNGVLVLSILCIVKPNNQISTIVKFVCYAMIAINVGFTIFSSAKSFLSDVLPNYYAEESNSGLLDDNEFLAKTYLIASFTEVVSIILLFTTNYAFSDNVELVGEDIDYATIKQDAINVTNQRMKQKYTLEQPVETTPVNQPTNGNTMNISNQLGQNSNVGVVTSQASTVNVSGSTLESLMPLSNGPVINNTMDTPDTQPQAVVEEVKVEATMPPNLDIQEQMQIKVQQSQQPQQQNMQ